MTSAPQPTRTPARDLLSAAGAQHDHLVGLYETDEFLTDSVVTFLIPALTAGEGALVVATPEHRELFAAALTAAGIDVAAAITSGCYVAADAEDTLGTFCTGGELDAERFRTVIGGLIERVGGAGAQVRVFGEMVVLLWEQGRVPAAIELEGLWNDLAGDHGFSLLCAYPMQAVSGEDTREAFEEVCRRHSGVIPTEAYSGLGDADERLRAVALLQQEARAGGVERDMLRRKQAELESALEGLQEQERIRNEFVAMVVHDVRAPATTIAGFLELLRDSWEELDRGEIRQLLGRALGNAEHIQRLVGDILTMAQIDSASFTFDLRRVDLRALAERTVTAALGATGRDIRLEITDDLPPVLADGDRQVQILENLLGNALKFSDEEAPVRLRIARRGEEAVVSVQDGGIGIAAPDLAKLFRPFSRLPQPPGHRVKGTGLGLYITRRLVEGQSGRIWAESTRGVGTTFSYTVPLAD